MAETVTSTLLCLCGLAIRRPHEKYFEYGFHTNYLNWKEKLIDKNPNTKFTTICSFEPTNFSRKYSKLSDRRRWSEQENITTFDEIKKMVPEVFADKCWGFHSLNELDLSKLQLKNIDVMRVECNQILPAIRMRDIHDNIVSFDDYDYIIFLRPDSFFRDDVILKENSISIMGDTRNPGAAGTYFCTFNDWDYCWFGTSKLIKEWVTHFSNFHYLDHEKIQKIASVVVSESDKKFIEKRFETYYDLKEQINYVENYLYNFKYIDKMQYEGIARLGSPHQDGRPKIGFESHHGYDNVINLTSR